MTLSSSPGTDVTMAPCGRVDYSDMYGFSCSMTLRSPLSLRWQLRPWGFARPSVVSGTMDITPYPDCVGSQTHLGPIPQLGFQCHHYPRWQQKPSRLTCPQWQHGSWTSTWTQLFDQVLVIHMAFNGYLSHGFQPRPCLRWDHGPRQSPWQQTGPDTIMSPVGSTDLSDQHDTSSDTAHGHQNNNR